MKGWRRHFLVRSPRTGTKSKPKPLSEREQSPYYWWWIYLRRNQEYIRCCERRGKGRLAALYADFGDVRDDDFREWWYGRANRGAELFAEMVPTFFVTPLKTKDDWDERFSQAGVGVIAVNLRLKSRRAIKAQLNKWLKTAVSTRRGRPSVTRSTAKYPLHRSYSVANLKRIIDVYDAVEAARAASRNGVKRKTMYEIGKELKVLKWVAVQTPYLSRNAEDEKHSVTNIVSRLYNRGKKIIANTSRGVFPVG
jgi:hypothetical protein